MEWSIQQIARLAGTTSRTLRHYGDLGLVVPSRIGENGYRYYDRTSLLRLQRVLLLRSLGLGLSRIGEIMDGTATETEALEIHLNLLRQERQRLARQIRAVEYTLNTLERNEQPMAETMFDGFDHTQYREEVEERWGKDAYARSDSWWRELTKKERMEFMQELRQLNENWTRLAGLDNADPASEEAQVLAERHISWLRQTAGMVGADFAAYVLGLGDLYVSDERFASNYGGVKGARFVREALRIRLKAA